jgi:hypothetical protein
MAYKKLLINLGMHGIRHKISKHFLNLKSYKQKQLKRIKKILDWCHDQGLGA